MLLLAPCVLSQPKERDPLQAGAALPSYDDRPFEGKPDISFKIFNGDAATDHPFMVGTSPRSCSNFLF